MVRRLVRRAVRAGRLNIPYCGMSYGVVHVLMVGVNL